MSESVDIDDSLYR